MTAATGNGGHAPAEEAAVTDHDPLCQRYEPDHWCECDLIARVRADERGRIADLLQMKFSMTSARSHNQPCFCVLCAINSTVDEAVDWLKGGVSDE